MKRLVLVFLIAWLSAAPMAAEGDFTGRWTFSFDAGAYEQGTPQGARPPIPNYEAPAGAVITPVTVTLDVSALPGGGLVGTISGIQGVRWSGGGSPQGPVEIRDGRVDGVRLAFSAWRNVFDTDHRAPQVLWGTAGALALLVSIAVSLIMAKGVDRIREDLPAKAETTVIPSMAPAPAPPPGAPAST